MHTLDSETVSTLLRGADDALNPRRAADCEALLQQHLREIAAGSLTPDAGAGELLARRFPDSLAFPEKAGPGE